jgi:hypothetical protein
MERQQIGERIGIVLRFLENAIFIEAGNSPDCIGKQTIGFENGRIVLGVLVTAVVSVVRGWEYLLPWFAVAVGLVVSVSIGLFFGIYPAVKAARLDPVVALTKE